MSPLVSLWVTAVGAALVHFLWEGALVACLLAAALTLLRRAPAAARYAVSCLALFALPGLFALTVARLAASGGDGLSWLPALSDAGLHHARDALLPYLAGAWIVGMIALSVRSAAGWMTAQRLRRAVDTAIPAAWREKLEQLQRAMDIGARVRLGLSATVPGPCVVGEWRPWILLPLSALAGLPPEQLAAVLAHELAHVRRHDYVLNLLQRAVEVAFFYHPAVWWISREISEEREHCCDDLAVAACGGDRLGYARALVELEAWRAQWMVAAGGGSLTARVRRVLGLKDSMAGRGALAISAAAVGLAGSLALAGALAAGLPAAVLPAQPAPPAPVAQAQRLSLPAAAPARADQLAVERAGQRRESRLKPEPAVLAAPAARSNRLVVTFALAEFQACTPQPLFVPQLSPAGVVWISVGQVTRCVPVIRPVEVWVVTT